MIGRERRLIESEKDLEARIGRLLLSFTASSIRVDEERASYIRSAQLERVHPFLLHSSSGLVPFYFLHNLVCHVSLS